MVNAISSLVGEELQDGGYKFSGTVAAPNGSLYGIPFTAVRVIKFNPIDKSMTEIGPTFGTGRKWVRGAITDSDSKNLFDIIERATDTKGAINPSTCTYQL